MDSPAPKSSSHGSKPSTGCPFAARLSDGDAMRKSTKPKAPWTRAFPEQVARVPERRPVKSIRSRLSPLSKFRRKALAAYSSIAAAYIADHPVCAVCGKPGATIAPLHVHHIRGRAGALLCDTRFFLAVHDHPCHDEIHKHINAARKRGLIADVGDWGRRGE